PSRVLLPHCSASFSFHDPAPPDLYTLSLHDALPILIVEMAALRWLDHDDNATGYALKDARASISMGVISIAFLTAFKVITFFGFVAVYTWLAPFHLPTSAWWYWVLVVLGVDLGYYAHHRFSHRVNIAW